MVIMIKNTKNLSMYKLRSSEILISSMMQNHKVSFELILKHQFIEINDGFFLILLRKTKKKILIMMNIYDIYNRVNWIVEKLMYTVAW